MKTKINNYCQGNRFNHNSATRLMNFIKDNNHTYQNQNRKSKSTLPPKVSQKLSPQQQLKCRSIYKSQFEEDKNIVKIREKEKQIHKKQQKTTNVQKYILPVIINKFSASSSNILFHQPSFFHLKTKSSLSNLLVSLKFKQPSQRDLSKQIILKSIKKTDIKVETSMSKLKFDKLSQQTIYNLKQKQKWNKIRFDGWEIENDQIFIKIENK